VKIYIIIAIALILILSFGLLAYSSHNLNACIKKADDEYAKALKTPGVNMDIYKMVFSQTQDKKDFCLKRWK
jgi:hypothetical protein